jgi:hypothetical protein
VLRFLQVRRPCEFGSDGWPAHPDPVDVAAGQVRVSVLVDVAAGQVNRGVSVSARCVPGPIQRGCRTGESWGVRVCLMSSWTQLMWLLPTRTRLMWLQDR